MLKRREMLIKIYGVCFLLFSVLYIALTSLTTLNKIPVGLGFAIFLVLVIAFPPIIETILYLIAKKKIKITTQKNEYTIYALSPDMPFMDITTDEGIKRLYFTKEGKLVFCDPNQFNLVKKGNSEDQDKLICEISHCEASGLFKGYAGTDKTVYTFICDLPEAEEQPQTEEDVSETTEVPDDVPYAGVTPIGEVQPDYSNAFKNVEEYTSSDYPFPVRENEDPFA